MAEAFAGLAVAASVIAVIQISEQVVTACIQYYRTAKYAKADIQAVINVVGGLKTTLENLKMILDETEEDELPHLKSLDKPLEACCGAIESLAQKLGVNVDRNTDTEKLKFTFTKVIMWPWKEKEVNKVLETIERHKSTFILAVAGDTLQTTLMTQSDVGEIKDGIGTLKDDVSDIKTNVSVIPTLVSDQRTEKILAWLNTCDLSTNHAAARQKHEPTTGDWFIKSAAFTAWKSSQKSSLWLHGIPGAGKTVLCSTIIDHVKTLLAPETKLAYFYFDYNDSQKETVGGMLRSMIFQLSTASGTEKLPTAVDELFYQSHNGLQQPPLQSLINTFSIP
jgi:ankyrin repeat domain-containing protein 50